MLVHDALSWWLWCGGEFCTCLESVSVSPVDDLELQVLEAWPCFLAVLPAPAPVSTSRPVKEATSAIDLEAPLPTDGFLQDKASVVLNRQDLRTHR